MCGAAHRMALLAHVKQASLEILALVPDFLLLCAELVLDVVTGFGWVITAALLGHIEWASFQPREGRFCGCCGFSRAHARALQFEPRAHFGSCAAQRPNAAAVEQGVAGPFPFASTPPWGSN